MKVVTNRDGGVMVTMHFSGESRYEDVCALLDSYGISVSRNGLVYIQCPVIFLEPHPWVNPSSAPSSTRPAANV